MPFVYPSLGCTCLYQVTKVVPARNHGPRRVLLAAAAAAGDLAAPARPRSLFRNVATVSGLLLLLLGSLLPLSTLHTCVRHRLHDHYTPIDIDKRNPKNSSHSLPCVNILTSHNVAVLIRLSVFGIYN